MYVPLYPRRLKETTDQMGGRRRYATNNAPPAATTETGSADERVSTVDEAFGLAPSITLVVCCAAFATVCSQGIIQNQNNSKKLEFLGCVWIKDLVEE